MKRLKSGRSLYVYTISVLILILSTGCQTDSEEEAPLWEYSAFDSGEFAVFDYEDIMDSIQKASLEEEMKMDSQICDGNAFRSGGRFGVQAPFGPMGRRMQRIRTGNHLGEILKRLTLTEEQILQIRELMLVHRECIQEPLAAIRETSRALIHEANQERLAIINALRNGEIDHAEAQEQMESLNQRTCERIRENLHNQEQKEALCDCKEALFDDIQSLLEADQLALWVEWVAELEDPCLDG